MIKNSHSGIRHIHPVSATSCDGGKWHNLSVPWFSHLQNGHSNNGTFPMWLEARVKLNNVYLVLSSAPGTQEVCKSLQSLLFQFCFVLFFTICIVLY